MTTFTDNGSPIKLNNKVVYGGNIEVVYSDGTTGFEWVEDIWTNTGWLFTYIPGDDEKDPCWDYAGSNDTYPSLESALDAFICNTAEEN
jgi:hypothetical protein